LGNFQADTYKAPDYAS